MSDGARLTFFDVMSIINSKTNVVWDEDIESAYNPWMINRGYSNFSQSVLFANELNQYPDLDKRLQFDFYYHYLPKCKLFGKWDKATKVAKDEEMIMELFGVSRDKTDSYIKTLDVVEPNWRKTVTEKLDKGGRKR